MNAHRTLLALGLAAALAAPAFAADSAAPQRPDPAQHAQRMNELKAKLNLSAAQEDAWQQFLAASQPPARPPRPQGAASGSQRPQPPQGQPPKGQPPQGQPPEHGKREQAAQTFRAQLSAEQQKIFDENYTQRGPGRPPRERK